MKNLIARLKYVLTDEALNANLAAFERIVALEAYVKDLKWAIDKLGYDPAKHGYPPDQPKEAHHD